MPEKVSILKESGETLSSNIVSIFMIPDTEKKYMITTENAVDPHGLTVLHVSEMVDGNLVKVATDEEWSSIKTIMRAIISGNVGSYQYLPVVASINASGQYSRDISVSISASKQMIDNYNNSEKSAVVSNTIAPQLQQEVLGPVNEQLTQQPVNNGVGFNAPIQPGSIFPSGNNSASDDDEVIPGIAEVNDNGVPINTMNSMNSVSVPSDVAIVNQQAMVKNELNGNVQDINNNINNINNINNVPQQPGINFGSMMANTGVAVQTGMGEELNPQMGATSQMGSLSTQQSQVPVDTQLQQPVQQPMQQVQPVQPVQQPVPNMVEQPIVESNPVQPVQTNNVQVAEPSLVVPPAQIAQDVQVPSGQNKTLQGSFDPQATVDEVVIAAQEMFMEGVKNLVATIQEKVYRDLYAKEAQLKAREEELNKREAMLKGSMVKEPVPVNQGVNTMSANNIQLGPTIVSASNDVI